MAFPRSPRTSSAFQSTRSRASCSVIHKGKRSRLFHTSGCEYVGEPQCYGAAGTGGQIDVIAIVLSENGIEDVVKYLTTGNRSARKLNSCRAVVGRRHRPCHRQWPTRHCINERIV